MHAQVIAWLQEQIGSTARDGGIAPAIPIATTPTQHLSQSFFCRQAELVGCRLVKRKKDGSLLWGVIVETEADSQDDPACHGFRRRSPQKETLFGDSGRFYVYVSYGIHHCVKRAL